MSQIVYISGVDFGCGKTIFSALLTKLFLQGGKKVGYLNIVETGVQARASSIDMMKWITRGLSANLDYSSAYQLRKKCSPHLAFELEEKKFDIGKIRRKFDQLTEKNDFVIVDSAGSSLTQITRFYSNADFVTDLDIPVILVVPNDISAIQRLSVEAEAFFIRGIEVAGFVLNSLNEIDPIVSDDNIKTIEQGLQIDLLAKIPFVRSMRHFSGKIPELFFKPEKIISEKRIKSLLS